jgi:hypothetical protein
MDVERLVRSELTRDQERSLMGIGRLVAARAISRADAAS